MARHRFLVLLHGVLIAALLAANFVTPARLVEAALAAPHVHATIDAPAVAADDAPPCHEAMDPAPVPAEPDPCDGCSPATCELAGCLTSMCLPQHARLLAPPLPQGAIATGHALPVAAGFVAPPLRPPIA